MKRWLLVAALAAGCGGKERAAEEPKPARKGITTRVSLGGEPVEGEIVSATIALENPSEVPVIVIGWQIALDGVPLAGAEAPQAMKADEVREDKQKGEVAVDAHWVHDFMPIEAARVPQPSYLTGRRASRFRPITTVVAAGATREWTTRFAVPVGTKAFRLSGQVTIVPAGASLEPDLFAPSPDNPSLDPDEALRRWSDRNHPNAPARLDEPDDRVTLVFLRGRGPVEGGLMRDNAIETPARVGEEAGFVVKRRAFALEKACGALGLKGKAAWAGFWVVSDGAKTGFAREDGATCVLEGDHVDVFRGAWFLGVATFYADGELPAEIEKAFGPGGPVKGGVYQISVKAEKLFDFAKAIEKAGLTLQGNGIR